MTDIDHFFCTDCGGGLVAVPEDRDLLYCTACEKYFEIPAEHRDESRQDEIDPPRADELDGMRIKQLATLRRSAYRSRSHAVVACVLCVVAVVQAGVMTYRAVRYRSMSVWSIALALSIPIAAVGAVYFYRRAMALHREATMRDAAADAEQPPPDFSSLGDGSDQWKRLEDVR